MRVRLDVVGLAVLLAFVDRASSQNSNYTSTQLVGWDRPRGSLIRYDVYLDGGRLLYAGTSTDSRLPTEGTLFKLSLNSSFNVHDPSSPALFEYVGYNIPVAPRFDGFMFADHYELYAWG